MRLPKSVHTVSCDIAALTSNDFSAFFESRRETLLTHIEQATGKQITRNIQQALFADIDDNETDTKEI